MSILRNLGNESVVSFPKMVILASLGNGVLILIVQLNEQFVD